MAKVDKEYEWRISGMLHALNIAKDQGIDALEKDVKMRGIYRVPLQLTDAQFQELVKTIGNASMNAIFAIVYVVLHEDCGFGEQRLKRFYQGFRKRFEDVMTFDYTGEHYVSLTDFAVMMKEKYPDIVLDINAVELEQEGNDEKNPLCGQVTVLDGIINALKLGGYFDAAEFLEEKKKI